MPKTIRRKIVFVIFYLLVCFNFRAFAEGANKDSIFIFAPMTGWINNKVEFPLPNSTVKQKLSDTGQLSGIYMMCVNPKFVIGSLGHYSQLDKSYEAGNLFFANYYFGRENEIQPTLGFAADYIHIYSRLTREDVAPLSSLDVDSSIWAFHPTAGISYKTGNFRISPFVGYFNEQVNTVVSSPGMIIAGQNRNGFNSKSFVSLNYMSVGTGLDVSLYHFIRFDTKFYYRFNHNSRALYTSRNRLDLYVSKKVGLSAKIDYFLDENETNFFIFVGPMFAF
jgi:hypothetical protein